MRANRVGRSRGSGGPSGILLVDKPAGGSSARAVAIVRRRLDGPKVGHLGTLDPFATGLLPLCVGEGTKIAPYLNTADKSYEGLISLGTATKTDDSTGEVCSSGTVPPLEGLDWLDLARQFSGTIEQVPPQFSAIKRDGRPMYDLARSGGSLELEPREVRVDRLVFEPRGEHHVWVDLDCSKGTYVRSLARDLGALIGCGGHLESLRRTIFGDFDLEGSVPLEKFDCDEGGDEARGALIPMLDALAHLPRTEIDSASAVALREGRQHPLFGLQRKAEHDGERLCLAWAGTLVAIAKAESGMWTLDRVFSEAAQAPAGTRTSTTSLG
jgi:tRNA pseudouridine55 synthase